jgi:membrane fusion protein (multidrug efflux system)
MLNKLAIALITLLHFVSPCLAQWAPPPPVVVTTTVEKDKIQEGLNIPGTFKAPDDVVIRSKIDGEIQDILFQDGASVEKGDVLFQLRDIEKKALLEEAQAALHMNTSALTRAKELKAKGFLAQSKFDKVQSETVQAQAQLTIAKEELSKTKVTAPFEGVLSSREVSKGAYVKEYDPLVRLQDLDPLRFQFQIPVAKLSLVKNNMPVKVATDSRPGTEFIGKITVIEPRADEKTRNVVIYADFPNEKSLLIPGMFGNISILTADQHEALVIPEEALVIRREGLYVYKILDNKKVKGPSTRTSSDPSKAPEKTDGGTEDNKAAESKEDHTTKALLVPVTVGTRRDDRVEILSGLQEGDQIVLRGQENITENGEVEVYKPQS